jgi:hypothetical protein
MRINPRRINAMSRSIGIRSAVAALALFAGVGLSSGAQASGSCSISFSVLKGGWVIGASAGSGVMHCGGKTYRIAIGGLSAGLVFGGSETRFSGRAVFPHSPYDVAGAYGAAGAGGAVIVGAQVITLRNEKGATLTLSGRQIGLQVNLDLSGLAISVQ